MLRRVRRWLVFGAVLVLLTPVRAWASSVENRCERLDDKSVEELEARAQVLFYVYHSEGTVFTVECDRQTTRVLVSGSNTLPVDEEPGLVEGILVSIERYLQERRAAKTAPEPPSDAGHARPPQRSPPASPEPPPTPPGQPALTSPNDSEPILLPVPVRSHETRAGGVGLSLVGEHWPKPSTVTLGPRLDIGVGAGDFCGVLVESLRLALATDDFVSAFEAQVGLNWGAPFAPDRNFGAAALLGVEFLWGSPSRASRAATLALGWRYGQRLKAFMAWAGLELRLRTQKSTLDRPYDVELPTFNALLVVGGLFLVDGSGSDD